MYNPEELPVPFRLPDDNLGRKTSYSYVEDMQDEEYQRMCAAYYGMITHIDYNIGRLIKTLEEKSILENTIVIFTSDHGDYNGDRGLIRKAEWMYDGLLRVPLVIRLPGSKLAGKTYNNMTQHVDLAPTILEFLNIPIPDSIQGISFSNLLNGEKNPAREFAFYEFEFYRWTKSGNPDLGVAKNEWKLLFHHGNPNGVLTNTAWDPYETKNLFGGSEFKNIQAELTEALFNWLISTTCYRPERPYPW
jgi:arylsulfatase A-like enzyme